MDLCHNTRVMISIKILRLVRGKSQFELSLETRIPSYRLSVLESGKAEPRQEELEQIAKALGTTPEFLRKEISERWLERSKPEKEQEPPNVGKKGSQNEQSK